MMYLHYSFCVSGAGYRSQPWSRIRYDENHDVGLLRNESDTEKSTKYLKLRSLHIERACIKIHYSNACNPFAELPNQTWFARMLSLPWALKEPPFKGLVNLYYNYLSTCMCVYYVHILPILKIKLQNSFFNEWCDMHTKILRQKVQRA